MPDSLTAEALAILDEGQDMTVASLLPDGAPHAVVVSYASDQLALFFGCAPDSLKACNLARDPRVAVTITLPYRDWAEIRGLSLRGRARRLAGDEADRAGLLFLEKFSELAQYVSAGADEIALFEVMPDRVSVLDYRRGFGHVEHATVRAARPARLDKITEGDERLTGQARRA